MNHVLLIFAQMRGCTQFLRWLYLFNCKSIFILFMYLYFRIAYFGAK